MKNITRLLFFISILTFFVIPDIGFAQSARQIRLSHKAEKRLRKLDQIMPEWRHVGRIRFDSLSLHADKNRCRSFSAPRFLIFR